MTINIQRTLNRAREKARELSKREVVYVIELNGFFFLKTVNDKAGCLVGKWENGKKVRNL